MANRRLLILVVIGLSGIILVGGTIVAGLAYLLLRSAPPQLVLLDPEQRLRLSGNGGRVLADDASTDLFRYPSISPDGRWLAYIGGDAEGFAIYRVDLITGQRLELYRSRENPPMYMAWSPDSQRISFLSNLRSGGLGMHVVIADGSQQSDLIGTTMGSSYFAWTSDSSRLLLHTGPSAQQPGQIATYRPGESEPTLLREDPGLFQAPAWSVNGENFFYVAQPPVSGALTLDQVQSVLTMAPTNGGAPQILAVEPQAAIFFGRAPNTDQIAYTTVSPNGYGRLKLVGPSGELRELSRGEEQVAAFFWSPDGSQIAYLALTPPPPNGLPEYRWHVVRVADGAIADYEQFIPSQSFAGMLNYFDAYAISLDLWSPDGTALTYATLDGVYVLDLERGSSERIGDGVLGFWVGSS